MRFFRQMVVSFLLLAALCATAFVGKASAQNFHSTSLARSAHPALSLSATFQGCQQVELTLHGNGKPTSRCLASSSSGNIHPTTPNNVAGPNVIARRCGNPGGNADMQIFMDAINLNGPTLCIRGQGTIDFSSGTQPDGRNWNDQASAWFAGCSSGEFDIDNNRNGQQQGFSGGDANGKNAPSGGFDGISGHLPNDSLTMVTLDSDC